MQSTASLEIIRAFLRSLDYPTIKKVDTQFVLISDIEIFNGMNEYFNILLSMFMYERKHCDNDYSVIEEGLTNILDKHSITGIECDAFYNDVILKNIDNVCSSLGFMLDMYYHFIGAITRKDYNITIHSINKIENCDMYQMEEVLMPLWVFAELSQSQYVIDQIWNFRHTNGTVNDIKKFLSRLMDADIGEEELFFGFRHSVCVIIDFVQVKAPEIYVKNLRV